MKATTTTKSLLVEGVGTRSQREVLRSLGGKEVVPGNFTLPKVYASVAQIKRRFPQDLWETTEVREMPWDKTANHELDERLYPFQNNGVAFLASRDGILSFAPGLGKTATAIAAAEKVQAQTILVVTILTLLPTWRYEIKKWATGDNTIQEIRKREGIAARWCVTNYDFLVRNPEIFDRKWDVLIIDESIAIKNRDTKRFKVIKKIRSKAKRVWLLSGAPITRDLSDLWSQLNLISSQGYPSYWRFVNEYCLVQETNFGTVIVGSNPMVDPQGDFPDVLLSITKEEAGLNLPEMTYETVWVEMTPRQRKVYNAARDKFILDLTTGPVPITTKVAQMTRLCQIASSLATISDEMDSSKVDALRGLVVDDMIKTPCIIWTRFVASACQTYDMLKEEEREVEMIIGDTPESERERILDRFKSGGLDFLVMGTAVGKYGLTLTNTWTMIYFDLTYNFDDMLQSANRVHRIGLDHSPVVIKLLTTDSIEQKIVENLLDKADNLARLTNDQLIQTLLA